MLKKRGEEMTTQEEKSGITPISDCENVENVESVGVV
jgi:hypothetical protein